MSTQRKNADRQIVGFSLSPEMAKRVKTEAAKRGLSLRALFEDMWSNYESSRGKGGK